MEVLLEKSSPTTASLKVSLTKEDYQPKVDKTIKDYSKKVNLKGFRPGKVPTHVITRMYGKSILVDEVNHVLSHAITDYIRENKLQIVGDPVPNRENSESIDWDTQTEFEFVYDLGLATEFEIDFTAIPAVKHYSINTDEAEVEKTITSLQERFAASVHPETSEEGDMIFGELSQASSEFSTKTAIPTKQVKADALAQFIGLTKGATVSFDIQNTFENEAAIAHVTGKKKEDVAELTGEFSLTVEDITRSQAAEINQDFFDQVLGPGQVDSEEQFREKVLEIIKDNYNRESEALLRRDMEKALLDAIAIDVPAEFLKDWLERSNEGKYTREQIEEQFDDFAKSLKFSLIRNKIADIFGVKVEYPELLEYTRQMVRGQFGIYGSDDNMAETIDRIAAGYLADRERDNYSTIFNQVFDNKVFAVIREQLATDEQSIDVADFEKIAKGEN